MFGAGNPKVLQKVTRSVEIIGPFRQSQICPPYLVCQYVRTLFRHLASLCPRVEIWQPFL